MPLLTDAMQRAEHKRSERRLGGNAPQVECVLGASPPPPITSLTTLILNSSALGTKGPSHGERESERAGKRCILFLAARRFHHRCGERAPSPRSQEDLSTLFHSHDHNLSLWRGDLGFVSLFFFFSQEWLSAMLSASAAERKPVWFWSRRRLGFKYDRHRQHRHLQFE